MESATFKLCVFGDGGVGKTTLVNRYISGRFSESTKMTIGVDITSKRFELDGIKITLQLWDFGGEERFRFFLPAYARGSFGGIFIYDITRYTSLMNINEWLNVFDKGVQVEKHNVPILMVGSKLDLEQIRGISKEDAINSAQNHNIYNVIECSSKTGQNIELIFEDITQEIINCMNLI
jgi:small GTP-binding protein